MTNIKRSKYNALSGTIKVIDTLNEYRNNCGKGVKKVVRKVALESRGVAQETLKNADHRQKYGDNLVDQIGVAYKDGVANVYAPITTKCIGPSMELATTLIVGDSIRHQTTRIQKRDNYQTANGLASCTRVDQLNICKPQDDMSMPTLKRKWLKN